MTSGIFASSPNNASQSVMDGMLRFGKRQIQMKSRYVCSLLFKTFSFIVIKPVFDSFFK